MLNSIQRTSNYQNSRPNFGLLERKFARRLLDTAGYNPTLRQRALETINRANRTPTIQTELIDCFTPGYVMTRQVYIGTPWTSGTKVHKNPNLFDLTEKLVEQAEIRARLS